MRKLQSVIASAAKQSLRIDCPPKCSADSSGRIRQRIVANFVAMLLAMTFTIPVYAESKNWNAEGDATDWFDDANWLPAGKPTASDDAKVDLKDAQVDIGQAYSAKSLTIGGKKSSDVRVSNFVSGTFAPSDTSNNALLVRRDGKISLKGSTGKVTMKGTYKDSEEIIPDEPSFMLYVK